LWVRYGRFIDTVSTQGCQDVHDFRKAIHKEFGSKFTSYAPCQLALSLGNQEGEAIRPGLPLSELAQQPGYKGNSDLNPIYVRLIRLPTDGGILYFVQAVEILGFMNAFGNARQPTTYTSNKPIIMGQIRRDPTCSG
jgi:hypothetical protein